MLERTFNGGKKRRVGRSTVDAIMKAFTTIGITLLLTFAGCGSPPPSQWEEGYQSTRIRSRPAAAADSGQWEDGYQNAARIAACQSELIMLVPNATDAQRKRTCHEKWHYRGRYADLCYEKYVMEARRINGPKAQLIPEDTIRLMFCAPRAKNDIMTTEFYEKLNAEWSAWVDRN